MPNILADQLNVEVEGDHIIVTRLGSSFRATYVKSPDEPKIVESPVLAVDEGGPAARREFEALAWQAACGRARELGWLV